MFDRCLYFNTNHLSRVVSKIWHQAFAEFNLAPAHAYLLRLVIQQPGLAQKQIASILYLEKSTVTRFIDKMVSEGYLVRKSATSGNLKEQLIFPTNKANKIGVRLEEIGDGLYKQMTETIDGNELKKLVKGISELANKL